MNNQIDFAAGLDSGPSNGYISYVWRTCHIGDLATLFDTDAVKRRIALPIGAETKHGTRLILN